MLRVSAAFVAAIALSGAALAAQVPAPKATTATAKAPAAKSVKAAKATVITTTGTVSKFDAAGNTLTVTTPKGDVSFMVGSSASVMVGGKKGTAADLASHTGDKVSVRYTESGGEKSAQSVHVTSAAPKTASVKKTSTKKS